MLVKMKGKRPVFPIINLARRMKDERKCLGHIGPSGDVLDTSKCEAL